MSRRMRIASVVLTLFILAGAGPSRGQFKPQWMPGQVGLNAGILPSPGFSYVNMDINYNAGTFNGPQGNAVPATGTYNVWAVENIFYYVPDMKLLGGNVGVMIMPVTYASGSLDADITNPLGPISAPLLVEQDLPISGFNPSPWAGTGNVLTFWWLTLS